MFTLLEKIQQLGDKRTSLQKAVDWVKRNRIPGSGIVVHHKTKVVTPEVTGYLIESLYDAGEKELAFDLARWEASIQRPDGGFNAPGSSTPYTFDTAQIIRGFLAVVHDLPEIKDNLIRACDYVEKYIGPDGKVGTESYAMWNLPTGEMLSEYGNLYVLPPLLDVGQALNIPRYVDAARRSMDYFRQKPDLLEFKPSLSMLSHYFGYMMEALADMGEFELAKQGLKNAEAVQHDDGYIPAYPGATWLCATGLAQLALAWYKTGSKEPADRAMDYLEKIQNPSGGFYGGYGENVQYFHKKEISWAAKFFIDACLLRNKIEFDEESTKWFSAIDENDGRVQAILTFLGDLRGKKVIDVGCGKGRFLKVLKHQHPEAQYYGLDVSEKMIKHCPSGVEFQVGNMLNMKYPDNYFDCVYSVETIEHAMNIEAAIREMARVLKPNGKIIIIDKNLGKQGALKVKSWEKWFSQEDIVNRLKKYGIKAKARFVSYNKLTRPDGLFIAWEGIKG